MRDNSISGAMVRAELAMTKNVRDAGHQKPVTIALIGAGNRGRGIFGQYALDMPHRAKFVAVAEPDDAKRDLFATAHDIPAERRFRRWEDLFADKRVEADAVIVATWENERLGPALAAMKAGCAILTEKPLAPTLQDTIRITDAAARHKGLFMVCHQMRYIPFYRAVKDLIESGRYGRIVSIQHSENVSYSHMAHSFVRGFFNSSRLSPMLLSKSCHDMDFLCYLAEARPRRVSSFGSLRHFHAGNAPAGAPAYCLDGCPAEASCAYHVLKLYFDDSTDPAYLRQIGIFSDKRELREILRTSQFGRCVYRCDNNVVDNQVVQIEFANHVTATFTMCGLNAIERRITKISLENGEIVLDLDEKLIRAYTFSPGDENLIRPTGGEGTHAGGDRVIMDNFVDSVRARDRQGVLSAVARSLDGHLLVFAAEEARHTGQVVDVSAFESSVRRCLAREKNPRTIKRTQPRRTP